MRPAAEEERTQVEMTRLEIVLAVAMVMFLLLGGAWVFKQIQSIPSRPDWTSIHSKYITEELSRRYNTAENVLQEAHNQVYHRQNELEGALREYEFRREEYRVMLDKGIDDPVREKSYQEALAIFDSAKTQLEIAQQVLARAQSSTIEVREEWDRAQQEFYREYDRANRRYEVTLLAMRLFYAIPVFLASLFLFTRLRNAKSHLLVLGTALVGFSSLQLLFLFSLYMWHFLKDLTQIIISVIGAALSVFGIVMIKKYITNPDRLNKARFRKGLCSNCGFPSREKNYCINCGHALQEPCPSCRQNRPVGSEFCPNCGFQSILSVDVSFKK